MQARAWSLLLALVMLALLPTGWDGALAQDPWERPETGYDAGNDGTEEPQEQEALLEQRSMPLARTVEPASVGLPERAAVPSRALAQRRLARPYIPHPSRFSERRLI
jgi:hypothetical protein